MAERPFYETSYKYIAIDTNNTSGYVPTCTACLSDKHVAEDHCQLCGSEPHTPCDKCGRIVHVGEWDNCKGNPNDHGPVKHYGFEPYVDENLPGGTDVGHNYQGERVVGHFIDSRSTRQQIMKQHNIVSGGWGSNKHRSSRINKSSQLEAVADRAVNEAAREWSRR